MSRYGIQQVQLNGGTLYPGFSGEQVLRGRDVNTDATDGVQYETMQHVMTIAPSAEMTNLNLAVLIGILGTSGTNGVPIMLLDGTNGFVMVGGLAANGGGYQTGSVHVARTSLNGLVYLSSVRWSPKQKAEFALKGMFWGNGDGLTDPIVSSLVALPSQPVPNNGFALSALTINGVSVVSVNSIELSFDPKFEFEYTTGLPVPVGITGAGARGALSCRLKADIGDCAITDGTGSVSLSFKQYANGGGFQGSGHTLTFTLNANYSFEDQVGGSSPSAPMAKSMTVIPIWNGTTLPVTWVVA
jgi:hypothetical protein